MTDTVQTYDPINTLKPVAEHIWIVDGPIIRMQQYGVSIPFPTRMTVIRLTNGDLFLHSPIQLNGDLQAKTDALGTVRHLVSPNKLHYAYIGEWGDAYPHAIKWASPGVRERARSRHHPVTFDRELDDDPDPAWADTIDQFIFRGSRFMDEVVFFHKSSHTLILTDLIENFEPDKVNTPFRWLARLGGILDPDGKVPFDFRLTFLGNKDQARRAFQQLLAWQPQKVILAHGRWYPENGTDELKRAFRWLD